MAKKSNKKQTSPGELTACRNPKATREYDIEERLECGMVLTGSEVKSLRAKHADLEGAYGGIDGEQLYLHKMFIGPYEQAGRFGHETRRTRKLLVHRNEIKRLIGKLAQRGYTLVPTQVYFKNGRAKVELGLARGRKRGDERETLRREADMREARAAMDRSRR